MTSNKSRAALEETIRRAQEELAELDNHAAKFGQENLAVERYHAMVCTSNHTDGCGWTYEGVEAFDAPGSTRGRFKKDYLRIKENYEDTVGKVVTHEEFVRVLSAVLDEPEDGAELYY